MKTSNLLVALSMALLLLGCDPVNPPIEGEEIHTFSVSATKKVEFSSGTLQYSPSLNKWRFADSQTNSDETAQDWVDKFAWGSGNNPCKNEKDENDNVFVDWGTNEIGDSPANTWRTLTQTEWMYLLMVRPDAESLFGKGIVNDVLGFIILPDDWKGCEGLQFIGGEIVKGEDCKIKYDEENIYSAEEWQKMEASGAVFLPFLGDDKGTVEDGEVNVVYRDGNYWTSTLDEKSQLPINLHFLLNVAYLNYSVNVQGNVVMRHSVRLVKDIK